MAWEWQSKAEYQLSFWNRGPVELEKRKNETKTRGNWGLEQATRMPKRCLVAGVGWIVNGGENLIDNA